MSGRLLTQVTVGEVEHYRAAADDVASGLVVSGAQGLPLARRLRSSGFMAPLLLDAQRYKGKARSIGAAGMQPSAWSQQIDAGASVALSDSGYIPEGDSAALTSVLRAVAAADCPTVAVLPLATSWVSRRGVREELAKQILASKVAAVAIVLEHRQDPYSVRNALAGTLSLLALPIPILMLRCDGSAVGLLANGAHAAAVGVRSGLRHLYPVTEGGGARNLAVEAAYFAAGMSYLQVDKLAAGVAQDPDDPRWACGCEDHQGRSLGDLNTLSEVHIRQHSVRAVLREYQSILALPRHQRAAAWHARICAASSTFDETQQAGVRWPTPTALRHWQSV